MSVVFVMVPVALLLAAAAVVGFVWASRDGQFDDVDTPQHRVLFDEPQAESSESVKPTTPGIPGNGS